MNKTRHVIALGGGGFSMEPGNSALDKYILEQTGKVKPKVSFMAAAGGDAEDYIERFFNSFEKLECVPSNLNLTRLNMSEDEIEDYIMDQDVIYVGGGSTRVLMAVWKKYRVDRMLKKAYKNGTVMAGMSAGGICWFSDGLTNPTSRKLIKLPCLGLIRGSFCPHYDARSDLRTAYKDLVAKKELLDGYGAEDYAGVHFVDEKFADVIVSRKDVKVYRVKKTGSKLEEKPLESTYLEGSGNIDGISLDKPSATVRGLIDKINAHDIEGIVELMTDDPVVVDAFGINVRGKGDLVKAWMSCFSGFPNYRITPDEIIEQGDTVGVYGRASGAFIITPDFSDAKSWEVPAAWRATIEQGKVKEWRVYADIDPVRKIMKELDV